MALQISLKGKDMITWSSKKNGALPSWNIHVGMENEKRIADINEGCFSYVVTIYDSDGIKKFSEYVSNEFSVEEIKKKIGEIIMGKLIVNCKYDLGAFWNPEVERWLKNVREFVSDSDDEIEVTSIKRFGCNLLVCYSQTGSNHSDGKYYIDNKLTCAVEGSLGMIENKLLPICPKCGKDKGLPPSLTVYPGYCEKCREELKPEDFVDSTIICMSGKAGSGKDTVAKILVEKHSFLRMALADPLRDIVQLVFCLDHDSVWDRDLRELPLKFLPQWTVRKLLQYVGTEMFRTNILADIWIRNFLQRAEPFCNYVITDVRFPNELDGAKEKFGGKILSIEVVRKGCEGKDIGIPNHESERYRIPADIIIENDGTLEELNEKVEKIVAEKISL